ncbi:hypothetical protein TraAM80_08497 [Trypanosoma rangeli]|uniref:Uncharacterized protein n=1 Tax=Trypanosoma rangeli TaxID=5698 RepID=A0A3R7JYJ3_TRYRA|nr:uncharacterized protein TraAM80_08497 [Trypanosoma rangeli]RNE98917.1 hypothetical protein TraAM80_08497 [Trypanosoma rangeli]|eukprot:RNE98917.1 hypothetical protein TraAM80_08497 [Trypanosoma rangeli]
MATPSSLTSMLLFFWDRGGDAGATKDDKEGNDASASFVDDLSLEEFISHVYGTTPYGSGVNKTLGEGVSSRGTQVSILTKSRLLCPFEWIFASAPSSDATTGWHALRVNHFASILHTWSQISASLVSPTARKGVSVSFFPTNLSHCIMPFSKGHCCNGVYHEVRAHIPIHIVYTPLPERTNGEEQVESTDLHAALGEFLRSRRMCARLLRKLIHDACLKLMSDAGCSVLISTSDDVLQRVNSFPSLGDECVDEEMLCCACGCIKRGFTPVHHFLLPLGTALEPPTSIVFKVGIEDNEAPLGVVAGEEGKTAEEDEVRGRNVTILIHTVVRATRARTGDTPRWNSDILAYKALASLLPVRFAVQGASMIEVGEVGADGRICAWSQRTGEVVFKAGEQMQETWELLLPSPKPLSPCVATGPTTGKVKTQHNPYCMLTRSLTSHEFHAVDSQNFGSVKDEDSRSVSEELSCNGRNSLVQDNNKDGYPISSSSEKAGEEVVAEPSAEGGEEEEEEEEEEFFLDETKQTILSLMQELLECGRQGMELHQGLQCQLYSLLLQFVSGTDIPPQRRRNRGGSRRDGEDETGALAFLSAFLGTTAGGESEDAILQQAIETLTNCGCRGSSSYATFDDCVKGAAEEIQALEERLRAEPVTIVSVSNDGKQIRSGVAATKHARKRKNGAFLFLGGARGLALEAHRATNTASKRALDKNKDDNDGTGVVLRGSSSALAEVRQLIDDTLAKLRAAVAWGRQRVTDLCFTCQLCQGVLAPCLEARTNLVKAEKKARSGLEIDYIVSSEIAREAISGTSNAASEAGGVEEEEEEEEASEMRGTPSAEEGTLRDATATGAEVAAVELEGQSGGVEARWHERTERAATTRTSSASLVASTARTKRRKNVGAPSVRRPQSTTSQESAPLLSLLSKRRRNGGVERARKSLPIPAGSLPQKQVLHMTVFVFMILCGLGMVVFLFP